MMKSSLTAVLMAGVLCSAGCGKGPPPMVEVEGTVQLDGKPLEKVRVEFWPVKDGTQSAGLTNEQGKFVLIALDGATKGTSVGKHKVVLRDLSIVEDQFYGRAGADIDLTAGKKPRIAHKYSNVTLTPLEFDITDAKRDLVIDADPYVAEKEK